MRATPRCSSHFVYISLCLLFFEVDMQFNLYFSLQNTDNNLMVNFGGSSFLKLSQILQTREIDSWDQEIVQAPNEC